jgi:hypothetical protein
MYGLFQCLLMIQFRKITSDLHQINYCVQTQSIVQSVRFMFLVVRLYYLGTVVSNKTYNNDVMNLL